MSKLTLLLNSTFECVSFITERRMLKLVFKEKVEVLSDWDDWIRWGRGKMKRPAVVRLKYYVPRIVRKKRYNRTAVLKRDNYICQYCGEPFTHKDLTIDHVLPKSMGGTTCWENCVASCFKCNNVKENRTPKMAGMKLLRKPKAPISSIRNEYRRLSNRHDSWGYYVV